jgi:hypothetical protein
VKRFVIPLNKFRDFFFFFSLFAFGASGLRLLILIMTATWSSGEQRMSITDTGLVSRVGSTAMVHFEQRFDDEGVEGDWEGGVTGGVDSV